MGDESSVNSLYFLAYVFQRRTAISHSKYDASHKMLCALRLVAPSGDQLSNDRHKPASNESAVTGNLGLNNEEVKDSKQGGHQMNDDKKRFDGHDANRDPISGEPGAHPVGTGIGAAGAGTIGTVVGGIVGGPVGAVVGSVVGSVAGGLVGKGAAEKANPTVEDEYWRNNYSARPYIEQGRQYEDYQPAYRTGYEGYSLYSDSSKSYDEVESQLQSNYEKNHGGKGLHWEKAKFATRDAWQRAENESLKR